MKRMISFILALVLLIGLMPMQAFATEVDSNRLSLEGLNVLCLGDSITAGQGLTTDTRWTNVLASKFGWNLTNKSQGGISLSSYYYTTNGQTDVSIAKKAEVLKTMDTAPDMIIVWGGHNDVSYRGAPLGSWEDDTTDSFKGALKHIAELAEEYAPDATLFVLTPLWTTEAPSTLKVPESTTDTNWMFVDAIYEGAEAYGWIPINMDLCGITPFTKSGLLLDNIHPNEAGTEKIVEYLSEELASYGANSKKQTILFNHSSVSIENGKTTTLKAVLSPRSGNGSPVFTWSSSNSSVATVDANGKITAVAHGNATITATADNGVSADVKVSVAEGEHTYTPAVTAPTCTEQGYTTYICECGESYVDDYVDATGHTYQNGACTGCGAEDPSAKENDIMHIICYGQSFSTGSDAPYYSDSTVDNVYVYGGITNSSKGTELTHLTASAGNQHPIISAGNVLAKLLTEAGTDTDIVLGSYGSGGKTIAQLMSAQRQAEIKEEDGYTYDILSSGRYEVFQSSVSALAQYAQNNNRSISCPAIVYLQGETDQNTDAQLGYPDNPVRAGYGAGGDKEKYKEYMSRLKEDMQREVMEQYGQTEKPLFLIYQVSGTYTRTQYSSINMAQIEFAQENEDVILVQSPYFTSHYTNSHHLTQNGYRWLGEYIGRSIYTAMVEQEKPWPMLPQSIEVTGSDTVRISVSGAQNGLTIDTWTVENASNSKNLYGFYLQADGKNIVPTKVSVQGNSIELTLPNSLTTETVYVYYAGKNASGTGNIRDNCAELGFYEYLDDSSDTGTGKNQGVSHSSLDAEGNSIIGQKYPLYNWLASFCYEVEVPEPEQRQPAYYHWEMQESGLVSMTEENAVRNDLTLLQGTVEAGVLKKAQFSMETAIVLEHDRPWVIEWKAAGSGNGYYGGKFLSSTYSESHAQYLYIPADSRGMVAWGVGSDSANYGFQLNKMGIDYRQEHTYRIENRIANGENTVYLIVDGVEIGAMNTGYRTSANASGSAGSMIEEPKNWANGKEIYIDGIGAGGSFLLNNMKLSYLKVWENGQHTHTYTATVTAPTCIEQGYTTYTCECGDSYVDDYVDATGEHTWGNWAELVAPTCDAEGTDRRICETCSEEQYRDTRITGDPNRILVSNPLTKDYFAGKRVLLIGDSITAGVGTTKTYGEYLAESLGVTVTNKGSSGSGYCSGGAMATNKNLTEANVRNADIITIMLGVNDWDWAVKEGSWKGNPEYYDKSQTYYQLGDFNSTDTSTFYGALHAWCQKILAMQQMEGFEDKQFIVITPLITSWNVSVTSKKDWNQDKRNIHGHAFREYCTAIMEVCSYYDIPVFDANMFSGIYYRSATDNNVAETGGDGVHVNEAGHALLAESLEEFLLEGYTYETRSVKNGGHTYVNGICADCRLPYACNHVYNAVITAPTCTEQGYTTYTCECGDSYVDDYVDATGEHTYENGTCTGCGAEEPISAKPMAMRYDDHLDVTGKTVEIIDAGKPTSYQVGYGVEENKVLDTAVVTLKGNTLVATGIGTATVKIDGEIYEVTVTAAPISLLLLIGQSNMRGSEGNADQSIVCPDGMVYATFGDDRGDAEGIMNVNNATNFAASALTGEYSTVNVNGTTDNLSYYPINSLTEAGKGTFGPDSGFAYEWVKQTGEKVWVVNAAHGGSSITSWQPNATNFKEAVLLFSACQETLRKEIAAGHFTLSHMGYFWCQGCSDYNWTAEKYVTSYLAMHDGLKSSLTFDHDSNAATGPAAFEFAGIIPVRAGHDYNDGYREDTYADTTSYRFYESFMDLQMTGPRVAQYWMCNNPELEDIWMVCNIGEDWVWMPDGTNGVTEYFQAHYENGTVDYITQVQQAASWYTPTTPKAVHDSIHYNQIGYNEVGRESARNALIMLGEFAAPEVETAVELLGWDGYTSANTISASLTGNSGTLVVPKIYPVWKSKEFSFALSEGFTWSYYDILANDEGLTGVLTMGDQTVTIEGHNWSDWETLYEASADGPGKQERICFHCSKVETREIDGVWQIYDLADHLLELPENVCCDTNLWALLPHEDVHFTSGKKWGTTSTHTTSITIPVNPGDRIYATSWQKAGENGHETSNGIRVTFFNAEGIAKTLGPGQSDREFYANGGYLIAPEGTIAINIVMWYDSEDYEVYILNRDHSYENGVCTGCGAADPDYHLPGDINGDGEVDNKDLTRLFRHLSGYEVEVVEEALDINGDGEVNNKDLTRLFRFLSGYEVEIF